MHVNIMLFLRGGGVAVVRGHSRKYDMIFDNILYDIILYHIISYHIISYAMI